MGVCANGHGPWCLSQRADPGASGSHLALDAVLPPSLAPTHTQRQKTHTHSFTQIRIVRVRQGLHLKL